ncbi:hypothetical protein HK096_003420 [Nowakowskiella sp. JEL0078]|nr:hypothetical protein HK096_003420 [Nowakowskiella sp. JEL0078]
MAEWQQQLLRRLRIIHIGVLLYATYKIAQLKAKWLFRKHHTTPRSNEDEDAFWESLHEKNAKRVYETIITLQGLWIKAGQYLSTRSEILPSGYISYFRLLQDAIPSRGIDVTKNTICQDFNLPSVDYLFEVFDDIPLATASIAQVHRAKLRKDWKVRLSTKFKAESGADSLTEESEEDLWVVIKVQHLNVRKVVLRDINDLTLLIRIIGWAEPNWDFSPIINEWSREVPNELDFRTESKNTIIIRDALAQFSSKIPKSSPLHTNVSFADPVEKLVSERVLVMKYIDGFKLNSIEVLKANNVDIDEIVRQIIKSYAFQIYVLGFWNSDPHPGNFLVAKDKTGKYVPVLLDFGLTKRATQKEVIALSRVLLAGKNMDFTSLLSGFQQLGFNIPVNNPQSAMDVVQFLFRQSKDVRTTRQELEDRAEQKRVNKNHEREGNTEKKQKIRNLKDAFPGILVFFGRVIQLLRGLSLSLESEQKYLDLMAPFAQYFLENGVTEDQRLGDLIRLETTPPLSNTDFAIRKLVRDLIDEGEVTGVQVFAMQRGKVIVDVCGGVQGVFDPTPVKKDTLFPVFSCTKPIASLVVHKLVQNGILNYWDPVYLHWPEFVSEAEKWTASVSTDGDEDIASFGQKLLEWKKNITVAHLLSHRSGLHGVGAELFAFEPWSISNFEQMCQEMEMAVPEFDPNGTQQETQMYHILSFGWLIGGLVEKVTGKKFSDVLKTEIFDPLGIQNEAFIGIPAGVESRLAEVQCDLEEIKSLLKPSVANQAKYMRVETPPPRSYSPIDEGSESEPSTLIEFKKDATVRRLRSIRSFHSAISSYTPRPASTASLGNWEEQQLGLQKRSQTLESNTGKSFLDSVNPFATNPSFFNHLKIRRSVIPAANGHFSAHAIVSMFDHLICCTLPNESFKSYLFTSDTVHQMRDGSPPIKIGGRFENDNSNDLTSGWGLGFKRFNAVDLNDLSSNSMTSPTIFGHGGMGGSLVLSDLKTGVSVAVIVNKLRMAEPRATIRIIEMIMKLSAGIAVKEWREGADGIGREEVSFVKSA